LPTHTKHADSDLNDALEHVVYEIWKHRQSVESYSIISEVGGDASIEFRTLHHRVLLEFFYCPAKHPNNVVAWEFVDGWQSTQVGQAPIWLETYMTRCHTMLAHISTTRTEMAVRGLKPWGDDWKVVEPHLDLTISEFLRSLSPAHKTICLLWVKKWLSGSYPGKSSLSGLIPLLSVP
jgi:hypothetical protein